MSPSRSSGMERRLAELDSRYRAALVSYFYRRLHSHGDAEDLTQEVFLRIIRHPQSDALEVADSYIFTIASNLLRDRLRSARSRRENLQVRVDDPEIAKGPAEALTEVRGPERVLLGQEALQRVMQKLQELSPQTRDIFLLHRLEGMKHKEIAKVFGLSVSTIEKHIIRALKQISTGVG